MEIINELVENGYGIDELDELYEFCVDYIVEYEQILNEKNIIDKIKRIRDKKKREKAKKMWDTAIKNVRTVKSHPLWKERRA